MKILASTLTALMLALLLVVPAPAGGSTQDMATKTFKLTLYGDVPSGQVFGVLYTTQGTQAPTIVQFCGPELQGVGPNIRRISEESCSGGGTAYSFDAEFPQGTKLAFRYLTGPADDPQASQTFYTSIEGDGAPSDTGDFETLDADLINSAYYDSDTGRGGAGDGPGAPQMPDTGAGGLSDEGSPPGGTAALAALVAIGYAASRLGRWANGQERG